MKTTHVIQFFSTKKPFMRRQYRWRAVAANGRKVAGGLEGYNNNEDCRMAFNNFKNALINGTYETVDI